MSLAQKLVAIAKEVPYVQKQGYNEAMDYKYAGDQQITRTIAPKFLEHGILMVPSHRVIDVKVINDKGGVVTTIETEWLVTDGEETMSLVTVGQGTDRGDKGAFKAMTGSKKYAFLQLLMTATGDDPEDEKPEADDEPKVEYATSAQKKTLADRGAEVGLEGEALRQFVIDTTDKQTSAELTKDDMAKLFDALDVLKATGGKVITE